MNGEGCYDLKWYNCVSWIIETCFWASFFVEVKISTCDFSVTCPSHSRFDLDLKQVLTLFKDSFRSVKVQKLNPCLCCNFLGAALTNQNCFESISLK